MNAELRDLLRIIDQAYDHTSWHGPTLRGSIRRVGFRQAARRPSPKRHNIWEIVVHAAYWKYAVWRRLTGAPAGAFALPGSNWFKRPEALTEKAWRTDVDLLARTHRSLRAAIEHLPGGTLHRRIGNSKVTPFFVITGIAAHDLYHAGQIQLLKKLVSR